MRQLTIGKWQIDGASFRQAEDSQAEFKIKLAPELMHKADYTVTIPDFGLPDPQDAANMVKAMKPYTHVFMGCMGGIGRTGMMIGVVLMTYRAQRRKTLGYRWNRLLRRTEAEFSPADPVDWVRENFRPDAIETDAQEEFVRGIT